MPEYALRFARAARRELEALDTVMVQRLFPAIESLAREPRPRGCRKVQGADNLWRIRVGDYRVLYTIDDQAHIIDILMPIDRSRGKRSQYENPHVG